MNTSTALYGTDDYQLTDPVLLNAGPLTLYYVDGICKSIKLGETEIVKRIYMALRDHIWNTVHPEITPALFEKNNSSFHLKFTAEHKKEDIHFVWDGNITGEEDGTICFSMKGAALSTFKRNRIGFCVLHPLELCTGRACRIETVDGEILDETFPVFISPFQPFKNIRQIKYNVSSIASVSILCEGDIFELEDQRNWTDASFKTYSTPLALPLPVVVEKGTIIEQTIRVSVTLEKQFQQRVPKPVELRIESAPNQYTIPRLGVSLAKNEQITPFSAEMLQQLALSHLRIDIRCNSDTLLQEIESAENICTHIGVSAELALHFSDAFESELEVLLTALKTSQLKVSTFLLYKDNSTVTPDFLIDSAVPVLSCYAPNAFFGGGTNSYFVEINRNHPNTDKLDLICYSANPQVHTFDNSSIMENLPGIFETLRTVTLFQGRALPAISPLTLRPRINPKSPGKFGGADVRQKGLFCAAWTLGSLMHCIYGGVKSLTCFETTGPAGLMPSQDKSVYPLYHVLAYIQEMQGGVALDCTCNDQSKIAALVFLKNITQLMLIANLTDTPQQVTVFGLPQSIDYVILDETTFEESTEFPIQWRLKKGEQRTANAPFHIFDILPYSIISVESSLAR